VTPLVGSRPGVSGPSERRGRCPTCPCLRPRTPWSGSDPTTPDDEDLHVVGRADSSKGLSRRTRRPIRVFPGSELLTGEVGAPCSMFRRVVTDHDLGYQQCVKTTHHRVVRCKRYHEPRGTRDAGLLRGTGDAKSRCPGWLVDATLQRKLLDEAIVDPEGGMDSRGRPKRLWNALDGWYFVGVSTNEPEPAYNCYPEVPATVLLEELSRRAERTVEELAAT